MAQQSQSIVLGEGFLWSTVRSMVTSIEMVQARGQRRRTFGTLDEATRWLAEALGQSAMYPASLASVAASLADDRTLPRGS